MGGGYFSNDTIVAVATSLAGDAGVGIIRLSGPRALESALCLIRGVERPEPRYLHRIEVVDPENGEPLDDGLLAYFPEGQSFTGEEVVELHLHGGRFLLQQVLRLLIAGGSCRLALPGEFSFQAVRRGKLGLAGAQAISQLVGAKSLFEVQAARRRLGEQRVAEFDGLAASLREVLARVELSIDFVDQDVEVISLSDLRERLRGASSKITALLAQMRAAQRLAAGVRITLVGAPNAGKSTLFNALLSEDRAIVSPEAGTTRDVITEELVLGPYRARLADTAGIRESEGRIEREGISRARSLAEESALVVLVVDAAEAATPKLEAEPLVVLNKCDSVSEDERRSAARRLRMLLGCDPVQVSALRGEGIDALLAAMRARLDARFGEALEAFLPTEFQLEMLLACRESVRLAEEVVESTGQGRPELIAAALSSALKALSDLVGETTPDAVLQKIFAEFCIGK